MGPDPIERHLVLIIYGCLALLIAAFISAPPMNPGDTASWVQGVGSIIAVGTAVWIGFAPARVAARREVEAQKSGLLALRETLQYTNSLIRHLNTAIEKRDFVEVVGGIQTLARTDITGELAMFTTDGDHALSLKTRVLTRSVRREVMGLASMKNEELKLKEVDQEEFMIVLAAHLKKVATIIVKLDIATADEWRSLRKR